MPGIPRSFCRPPRFLYNGIVIGDGRVGIGARPGSHESRARREAVGRAGAGVVPGGLRAREGYFEGKGYQVTWALGHLATLKEPHDYDPALKKWSLAALPFVPERFGIKPIEEGRARKQLAVVRRLFRDGGRADLRHRCRPRGGADLPVHPGARRLHGQAGTPALAQLAHRVGHPRRLPPAAAALRLRRPLRRGPMAQRGGLGRRPERDPLLHRPPPRRRDPLERRPGADPRPGHDRPPRRRDPHFKPEPFWELLTQVPRRHLQVRRRSLRQGGGRPGAAAARPGPAVHRSGASNEKPERVPPPQLYDLTELQRDMNRRYGMSADATLKAAQSLYENKLISYPRTDSRYLGNDMKGQVPGILEDLKPLKPAEIGQLDLSGPALHRPDHQRRQGERSPRDHPDRQAAGRRWRRRPRRSSTPWSRG